MPTASLPTAKPCRAAPANDRSQMTLALPFTRPPAALLVEPAVRAALEEDLGRAGDVTSELTIPEEKAATARFIARQPGRIAGLICAEAAFRLVDPSITFQAALPDGS